MPILARKPENAAGNARFGAGMGPPKLSGKWPEFGLLSVVELQHTKRQQARVIPDERQRLQHAKQDVEIAFGSELTFAQAQDLLSRSKR